MSLVHSKIQPGIAKLYYDSGKKCYVLNLGNQKDHIPDTGRVIIKLISPLLEKSIQSVTTIHKVPRYEKTGAYAKFAYLEKALTGKIPKDLKTIQFELQLL